MEIKKFQPLRQPLTPEQQDEKLKNVAKLYEKQFLREMMKQMRATVTEGGFMPANNAEKIFREQLDQEYVEKWGDRGGIGLADMIHQQLLERLGPALGIRPKLLKPQGPIKINEQGMLNKALKINDQAQLKSPLKIQTPLPEDLSKSSNKKLEMKIDLREVALENSEVTAPWSGVHLGTKQISPDEYVMEILHDHGLKSQMVFRGQPVEELRPAQLSLEPDQERQISAGQRIGLLSPEAKSLFWTVSL